MSDTLSRRGFLTRSMALGCSAAAAPLLTPVTLAAAPWEARLVVIILRGAMDGLDVVQPYGDRDFAAARSRLPFGEAAGARDLDGFFAMHPALGDLGGLWDAGELGFVHAVSTPYRDKRSHFDGQDLLEAGTGFDLGAAAVRDGWLNRMLQTVPGVEAETAFSVGPDALLVLSGAAPVSSWSPEARLSLSPAAQQLLGMISAGDPLFSGAVAEAIDIAQSLEPGAESVPAPGGGRRGGDGGSAGAMDMARDMAQVARGAAHVKVAEFAASRLRRDTRIAAFSINGWDTHRGQAAALRRPLGQLAETIQTLKSGLGPVWDRTAVLAMTEFGRTVRENGSGGTDHGTGGAMVLAGGAVRGGQVHGKWPGLSEAALYKRRDLMPTADVRAYAAAAMQGLFGLDRAVLEAAVFPGLEMGGIGPVIR